MPDKRLNSKAKKKRMPRPAILADNDTINSYPSFLQHLLVGLADENCSCALICPPRTDHGFSLLPNVKTIDHPMFKIPLFWLQNQKVVYDKLVKFKPTVLHCVSPGKIRLTKYLSAQLDIPYLLSFNHSLRGFIKPVISTKHCGGLIAASKSIADELGRSYRRCADRIYQINMGTFVEDECACFSSSGRATSMVVAGPLTNPSVFEPLLSALRHLAIDGYEFMLVIIGTGRAQKHIHEMIKALGLSQMVAVVGDMNPLRRVLAGADMFIEPQLHRRCCANLLEAMSVGTAVACCTDGIDLMLREDKMAVFFDRQDEIHIYSCLQKLLGKKEFARGIALGGQRYVRENHSVSKMVELFIEAYFTAQRWYKESE